VARTNSQSVFAYALAVLGAKSLNEVVELSSTHLQKQFQLMSDQTKELASLAQKAAAKTTESVSAEIERTKKS
jgi:hypothetical protein